MGEGLVPALVLRGAKVKVKCAIKHRKNLDSKYKIGTVLFWAGDQNSDSTSIPTGRAEYSKIVRSSLKLIRTGGAAALLLSDPVCLIINVMESV